MEEQVTNQIEVVEPLNKEEYRRPRHGVTRYLCAFIDFTLTVLLTVILYFISVQTVFSNSGYSEARDAMRKTYEDTHLFIEYNGGLYTITSYYDKSKTPEENYDPSIIYFYTNYQRAINDNKLAEYNQAKIDSNLYNTDVTPWTWKEEVTEDDVLSFYKTQYSIAYNYLLEDEDLLNNAAIVSKFALLATLSSILISSLIFYVVIPMIDKKGRTLSFMMFKLVLVKRNFEEIQSKPLILTRNLFFIIFTLLLGTLLLNLTSNLILTMSPAILSFILILCTPSKSCLHDLVGKCSVAEVSKKY